jgi:AraC-like DNA-binding protein
LYLYVKSLTQPEATTSRPVFDYYAPLILRLSIRLSIVIFALLWNMGLLFKALTPPVLDYWDVITAEPLSVLVFCIYLALAFKEFSRFSKSKSSAPESNQIQNEIIHKWLKILLHCMVAFAVIWIGTVLSPMLFKIEHGPHYYLIEVLVVFFIYWIAFVGYYRTKVVYVQPQKTVSASSNSIPVEEMHTYAGLIEMALEKDKLYRDPDLTVSKLAAHIHSSPKLISAVMNQYLNKGFSECINAYRVEEVKERLLDRQYSHLTISGIALESGFNSQATFQRAFKNSTGMSPKEFLASQTQKSA